MAQLPQCPPAANEPQVCCVLAPGEKECCELIGSGKGPGGGGSAADMKSTNSVPPDVKNKIDEAWGKLEAQESKSLLKKYLTREVYENLKDKTTPDGSTLLDVIQSGVENPDSGVGIYAPDPDAYTVFAELFDPVISDYHKGFKPNDTHPDLNWGEFSTLTDLDPERKYIKSTRVRCGRSIEGYPFNPRMTLDLYLKMEKEAEAAFIQLDGVHAGKYESLESMTPDRQQQLIDDHFLFKEGDRFLQAGKACQFWPKGRGILLNPNNTFLVWVGEEDHLRIIAMEDGGNLGEIYKRMVEGVEKLGKHINFVRHPRLGFITFCPTNLGTTVRASVMIKLPKIGGDLDSLEAIAEKYNLQVRGTAGEHSVSADGSYDISNKRRLGLTEFEAVSEMHKGLTEMIKMEENA